MMGAGPAYFSGLGINILRDGAASGIDFLKYLASLGVQQDAQKNAYLNEIDKREMLDQNRARKVKNKYFQTSGRVVFWALIFMFGFVLIAGGFSHFANFTHEPVGWLLRPFMGSEHYVVHQFTHTFVIAPWMEDVIAGIVGFFSGHIARRR